jgi:diguanylate cyclase (GGDEF)-like protein
VNNLLKSFVGIFKKPQETEQVDKNVYLEAFENSGIYAKLDSSLHTIHTNRQFCQIMQTTKQESLHIDFSKFMKNDAMEIFETLKCKQSWEGTKVFITSNEDEIYLNCSFIPIYDTNDSLFEVLFLATDITELMLSKTNIKNNLYQDNITKLPNRLKLFTDKSIIKHAESTYIIFNIDSFDSINNLYGNQFGDKILSIVARWLENNLINKNTQLYKLEADIYLMVCSQNLEEQKLLEYLRNISKKIQKEKFLCDGAEIDISMTIGASQGTTNQLKLSQIAYKDAKLSKKSFAIYDKKSNKEEEYRKNIQTSKTIKYAIENDLVIPYFQPIMNIETGKIEKYESLMRIKDENEKVLSPYEFLDIAKRSKVYPKLSCSLIEKSVEAFSVSPCEFSVNLSFLDITNKTTTKFILDLLEKSGMGPWMIFELLESEGIENYKDVMYFIEQIKSYGAKVAIDDFGSGYSNFERMVELRVDFIKIDGSLIKHIDQNDDMRIITKTIVNFAKELNIKTVAEYVHSEEVLHHVKMLGVDFAQGYHIGKPSEHF